MPSLKPSGVSASISIPILLCLAALAPFYKIWPDFQNLVISAAHTDIAHQFLAWRDFGFGEIKNNRFPLWNPHLFCGAPFFGGFQAAMLYPPNLLYLILPLKTAVNTSIILHVFLFGLFTYFWSRGHGFGITAALLTGLLAMFNGAFFLHIYAGHLSNICAMSWVPLIFRSVDHLMAKPSLIGWVGGCLAFAAHILAGHPQYVYYTVLAIAIYGLVHGLCSIRAGKSEVSARKTRCGLMLSLLMPLGGAALCAVQILPGLETASESVRSGGVPISFAAMFSFPPENLLTLVTPYLFGFLSTDSLYWGRTYLWETNLFFGVVSLTLAFYGILEGGRRGWTAAFMSAVFIFLALGAHTPLFTFLFDYLPGFNRFRGTAKFIFYGSLFLAFLAGLGWHRLQAGRETPIAARWRSTPRTDFFYLFVLIFSFVMTAGGAYLALAAAGNFPLSPWKGLLTTIAASGESYVYQGLYGDERFIRLSAHEGSVHFFVAGVVLLVAALFWRLSHKGKKTGRWCLATLAVMEVFVFAMMSVTYFDPAEITPPGLRRFVASIGDENRILNLWRPNLSLHLRTYDLWGYDPVIPRRYAELMAFTQGQDPRQASQNIHFHRYHPLFRMLRLRYIITPGEGVLKLQECPGALGRVQIVRDWHVETAPGRILAIMDSPDFDPEKRMILEQLPPFIPTPCTGDDQAQVVFQQPGEMVIAAHLSCPGMLLITDNYTRGWQAVSLVEKRERNYEIFRANYTLMAIPLEKGEHRLRVFYRPRTLILGAGISALTLIFFGAVVLVGAARKNRGRRP